MATSNINMLNTINVDGVTYNAAAYEASKAKEAPTNDLDKNAFLKLLITQLENQDPLDPQENSEFVAEMAQFSSLEQMTNMNTSLDKINTLVSNMDTSVLVGQLSSMIGKGVDWENMIETADEEGKPVVTTETLSGVITGVTIADGVTKVTIETEDGIKYSVDIGKISKVYDVAKEDATAKELMATDTLAGALDALETEMITGEA